MELCIAIYLIIYTSKTTTPYLIQSLLKKLPPSDISDSDTVCTHTNNQSHSYASISCAAYTSAHRHVIKCKWKTRPSDGPGHNEYNQE